MEVPELPIVHAVNERIVRELYEGADLLEAQNADVFRVLAYRRAAEAVRSLEESASAIFEKGGIEELIAVPGIGPNLAMGIADIIEHGTWRWLDHLRGEVDPAAVFQTIADIGPVLAARLHHDLGLDSLEDLETAAADGRLATVPGFGPKRIRAVSEALDSRLRRRGRSGPRTSAPVDDLLAIDREYSDLVAADALPKIAPRRLNPSGSRWLPILHTERSGCRYTAMFSNTARAHALDRCRDWVVIIRETPDDGQWTVVTERTGSRRGERVVRGHETATHGKS